MFIGNWCFSLCKSPTTGLIFWDKCAIWSVQVRLSFNMMPIKLKDFTFFTGRLSIFIHSASNSYMLRWGVWNIISLVCLQ